MENKQLLEENVLNQERLWVQIDEENHILNWGNCEIFESDGYIPIELPSDKFFFKSLGDCTEYGHKYFKVVDGKAVLDLENFKEIPDGYGIVRESENGIYFDTTSFMAKKTDLVHEVITENLEFYNIVNGELALDTQSLKLFNDEVFENELRAYRNEILLPAFDKWEKAILMGREVSKPEVYEWYEAILDLKVEAINSIPKEILYFINSLSITIF